MTRLVAAEDQPAGTTPAPPPAEARRVGITFNDLVKEAEGECARHRVWRDDFRKRATDPAISPEKRAQLLALGADRARLVDIYEAYATLVCRCNDDMIINERLKVLARVAAERDLD